MRTTRRDAQAGFMLVEALVAMAVCAFLLVALASVTGLVFRALDRTDAIGRELESRSRLLSALTRDLALAERLRWNGTDGAMIFAGTPTSLTYATAGPGNGFMLVRLDVEIANGVAQMVRRWAPLDATAPSMPSEFSPPERLYAGAPPVFAFYGEIADGLEGVVDTWPEGDAMPVAIRVAFQSAAGPEDALRIPLRVDAEIACAVEGRAGCTVREEALPQAAADRGEPIDPNDPLGWMRYAQ